MKELPKLQPVTILLTTYNRIELLKKTIKYINERTFYPYRIIVIDNNSTDGTKHFLKEKKVQGQIFDHLFLEENIGQSRALNKGFELIEWWENEKRRPSSDFFITTNDDIYPPMFEPKNCWLKRMIDIFERNEPEYGGLCQRIQRTPRNEIDESKEIIPCYKGFPSVFRLLRRSDYRKLGDRPFGRLMKWDSNSAGEKFRTQLQKKFGFTTKIYADHAGFIPNKGFPEGTETFTVAANKVNESKDKPYPEIDPLTNVPTKINHKCDGYEQQLREEADKPEIEPEVTILILTYKRLDGLKRMVDSVRKNTKRDKYKLLVMVDNDDTDSYNYCIANNIKCILSSVKNEFVLQVNIGISACKTPYIVKFDDDQEIPDDENWLERAIELYKKRFPENDGLLCFNDDISHGAVFTTGLFSKKLIYALGGYLYHPKYLHYSTDRQLVRLAKHLGLYYYEKDIKINHFHPSKGTAEKDDTYKASEDECFKKDQRLKKQLQDNLLENKNYCDFL